MQKAFDKTRLKNKDLSDPIVWATAQKQRLLAARPDILPEDMIIKILEQCPGDINHAVRSRMTDEADFIGFTEVLEEVILTTSIGRQIKSIPPIPKPNWKENNLSEQKDDIKHVNTKNYRSCRKCGSTDPKHDYRGCTNKNKTVLMIEHQNSENTEEQQEDLLVYQEGSLTSDEDELLEENKELHIEMIEKGELYEDNPYQRNI